MFAVTESNTAALITVLGSIIVAGLGVLGVLLARQNSRQHGQAIDERATDRARSDEYRNSLDERFNSLDSRLQSIDDRIVDLVHMTVDHVSDPDVHGG